MPKRSKSSRNFMVIGARIEVLEGSIGITGSAEEACRPFAGRRWGRRIILGSLKAGGVLRWRKTRKVIDSVFRTQKDAPRFALFEVAGDSTLFVSPPADSTPIH
jgi:hypothetical protein